MMQFNAIKKRALANLLALVLVVPTIVTGAPLTAAADSTQTSDSAAPLSAVLPPSEQTFTAMNTSMTAMLEMMSMMDTIVDPEAMRLHMELMSPEMKQMMADMMGGSTTTSSTAGAHDHAGHSSGSSIHRVGDASVADRAVALSRSAYETATVTGAVLVNLVHRQEAVAAAGLAGSVRGPLLPTAARTVSAAVVSELHRLGVRTVYIVGPTSHVSNAVRTTLQSEGFTVKRISGADRYATAAAIARKIAALRGTTAVGTVFVVSSDKPWDALTVTPYAYSRRIPILFVSGTSVPAATAKALSDLKVRKAVVVSSGITIRDSLYRAIARQTSRTDVRLTASTRWALADAMMRHALAKGWATTAHPVLSNGVDKIGDALVAGPHAGAKDGVLLLSPPEWLPRVARVFVNENRSGISHPVVVGTTATVSDAVLTDLQSLLQGLAH